MSKLNDLINKLCPDGVPYKKLGDLCVSGNKGMLKKNELIPDGKYPVVNGGMNYYGRYNQYNNDTDCFVFSSRGSAGYVSYQKAPFYAAALCYPFMSSNENIIMTRFMYFFLKQNEAKNIDKLVAKGSIPALNKADVLNIEIPVPPIEVQHEVVRILDSFTELEAELEAELAGRKEQYEYYRDYLLDKKNLEAMDGKPVETMKLNEVLNYEQPSKYLVSSKDYSDEYSTPVLTAGKTFILGYTNEVNGIYQASKDNPVIIFDDFTTDFKWVNFPFKAKSSGMKMLTPIDSNTCCFKYIYYAMSVINFVPSDHKRHWISQYSNFEIPVPSLATQERVVDILDRFDALTTSLTNGIPAEIAMRREQYEYYRSRLLDFPRLPDDSDSDGE